MAVAFGVAIVLARSPVGRWILAFGALGLLAVAAMFGFYFVTAQRWEDLPATIVDEESFVESLPAGAPRGSQIVLSDDEPHAVPADEGNATATIRSPSFDLSPQPGEPIRKQTAGAARPAWMDEPTGKRDGVYRTIATAGPYTTPQECHEKLNEALNEAVKSYIDRFLTERAGAKIALSPSFIHEHVARGEWLEQSEYSVGPMYNLHALLVFDKEANQEIDRRYRESQVAGRLAATGVGAALVLGLIGTLFGYLKLDTLTRGYYTGRLRAAAAAAILALAGAAGILVERNFGF
ncbi:MAG TPA: hypothetical protein VMV10_06260 [Pirellulales bacterium]|nr:hypothetical protein [Pirellulales bacterium]